jgi:hypothetical protein
MPRVNRDVQRRIAARRERERRRPPGERRHPLTSADPLETVAEPEDQVFDGAPEMVSAAPATPGRRATARAAATPARAPSAGRPTGKPFSAYREEYNYVTSDLRRIVVVVGVLLVVLIALHFVLAR